MQLKKADFAKTERIVLRIDRHTKRLLNQAAVMDNRSLTGFIIASAKAQAEETIDRETTIRLKHKDWEHLMKALDNPPKPNAALKKLLRD